MRIKFHCSGIVKEPEFFIEDFPFRPVPGDLVRLENFIDEKDVIERYSEKTLNEIYKFFWSVWYCLIDWDKQGIFLFVALEGE